MHRIVIALVALIGVVLPATAWGHPGGLDKYGCHAGSQPYHCHSGGSGPSGEGGSPAPTPVETGPSAAELAAIASAEAAVAQAKTTHESSKKRARSLKAKRTQVSKRLVDQQAKLDALVVDADEARSALVELRGEVEEARTRGD